MWADLHQGPDLLCLLSKKEGVRVPKDPALAGARAGARVYPGLDLRPRLSSLIGKKLLQSRFSCLRSRRRCLPSFNFR
ncbi:hypothetical protein V6N13_020585 [Hibiscus sabdariffa]|uniref:Uncharacterized protein n=1 Tax=Hibiscus sabdariffa TaxID=183260 RepID=A0ABR2EU01_9ROSI